MMTLCLVCLACSFGFLLWPDPRAKAEDKAEQDAVLLGNLMAHPDRIGWRMTEDPTLVRAILWDSSGALRYPPPDGFVPWPYMVSENEIRDLTSIQSGVVSSTWNLFGTSGDELLNCREKPAICIVYDRPNLEATLGVRAGAFLSSGGGWRWSVLLAALSAMFGGAAIWSKDRSGPLSSTFTLDPERHSALRGTLEISLSPRDLKLLSLLDDRNGAVVTKDELYNTGWGRDFMPNSRALDQHIINLRRKLDPDKSRPVLIETVHGVGYRLVR